MSDRARLPLALAAMLRVLAVAILCVAPLAGVRSAGAQGTDGALPDPVSTQNLMSYANRLGLSGQQRLAVEGLHDDYKREYRSLRDGEIDRFMKKTNSFMTNMPTREVANQMLEDYQGLQVKIRVLDDRFFDRIAPILTDPQLALLPRVRLHRERNRAATQQMAQMMMMAGRRPIDVSDLFYAIETSADDRTAIDPALAGYERRLTTKLSKLNTMVVGMFSGMFDAIEEAGYAGANFAEMTPEEMQAFGEMAQQVWMGMLKDVAKLTEELRELDRRTADTVLARLEPIARRRFRHDFVSAAYPQAAFAVAMGEGGWMMDAETSEALDETQRDLVRATIEEFESRSARAAEEAMKLVEDQRSRFESVEELMVSNFGGGDANEELRELAEAIALDEGTVVETLRAALGDELLDTLMNRRAVATATAEPAVELATETSDQAWTGDQFIAPRISSRDLTAIVRRLGLGDRAEVVRTLHVEYVEAVKVIPAIETLRESVRRFWAGESDATPERLRQLRRDAMAAMTALDNTFFDDLAILVTGDDDQARELERLRAERLRVRWNNPRLAAMGVGSGSPAGSIDLAMLVRDEAEASIPVLQPVLDDYARDAEPLFAARFEALLDQAFANETWNARVREQSEGNGEFDWTEYQALISPANRAVAEVSTEVHALNERTLDNALTRLDPEQATHLRRTFLARAFPEVWQDPMAMDVHLTRALALGDLSPSQREQIAELAATYRPEYDRLSMEIVELSQNAQMFDFENREEWSKIQERSRQTERLRYDRSELNSRAINRLQSVLDEVQIIRIGGLPEPEEANENMFGF